MSNQDINHSLVISELNQRRPYARWPKANPSPPEAATSDQPHPKNISHPKSIPSAVSGRYGAGSLLLIAISLLLFFHVAVPAQADLGTNLTLISPEANDTSSLAWGDWDGDGDLDLAVGNDGANQIFENNAPAKTLSLAWQSTETHFTTSVAWGDWDGDGDLDLAVGNSGGFPGEVNQVYENEGGTLVLDPGSGLGWQSTEISSTASVAWGDWDDDGDLDLAVGNSPGEQANQVYENEGGTLVWDPASGLGWQSAPTSGTSSLAWGDWDDDGDLDLAVGNINEANQVYENEGGTLVLDPANGLGWESTEPTGTRSLAWGDWDDDGDLDLAVGNCCSQINQVYENTGGMLVSDPASGLGWQSTEIDYTMSVAWGDWDGDGDLDLAVGNDDDFGNGVGKANRVYENDGGTLKLNPVNGLGWQSPEARSTTSLSWGDWDGDGDLDLAAGNGWFGAEQVNQIYENEGQTLVLDPDNGLGWEAASSLNAASRVAWGDWDDDGDLDLAVGNTKQYDSDCSCFVGGFNQVFENEMGALILDSANGLGWEAAESNDTTSVAWGDWDDDGDLDLAVGNTPDWNGQQYLGGGENQVYENDTPAGTLNLAWQSTYTKNTSSLAWGDWDDDGDLDLAVGNGVDVDQVYENEGDTLMLDPANGLGWQSVEMSRTTTVAWGDWDGDGDLDLATGNLGLPGQANLVYENDGGTLKLDPANALGWQSTETDFTTSVAWGDWDGDGDLDLAVGNGASVAGDLNQVYENDGGTLNLDPGNNLGWQSTETDFTLSVAWGDWDGDGDLDLAVGNVGANQVYENDGETLSLNPSNGQGWESSEVNVTHSLAWGDWDGDGDLDLAVGNGDVSQVYENARLSGARLPNNGPVLTVSRPVTTANADFFSSPAFLSGATIPITYTLIDPDGDRIQFIRALYSPSGGGEWLPATAGGGTITSNLSTRLPEHYASGNRFPITITTSSNPVSSTLIVPGAKVIADIDVWLNITHTFNSDLDVYLKSPTGTKIELFTDVGGSADGFISTILDDEAATPITSGTAPFTGRFQPEGNLADLEGEMAIGTWTLVITDDLPAGNDGAILSWGINLRAGDGAHVFSWAAEEDLIKNDNVVFRVEAYQGFDSPGPYHWPLATAQTFPFRVAAEWYVKVTDEDGNPVEGAIVYYAGQVVTETTTSPDQTNRAGLLRLNSPTPGQPLVALAETKEQITTRAAHDGWAYRTYITSLNLDETGVPSPTLVNQLGEQRVTIRPDDPLVLFNTVASVEWDATEDYLNTLIDAFRNASDYLYDVTDGQMAFGQVNIYDNAQYWADADFQFSTKNTVRPYAFLGGITSGDEAHTIRVGRFWDGGSGNSGNWNEPHGYRTLIHEFGHYALYLHDEYFLRLVDGSGNFIGQVDAFCTDEEVATPGNPNDATNASLMFYQYNASELADKSQNWDENCEYTEQYRLNDAESDWETLLRYYDGSAWTINTPSSRGNIMAGPTEFPTQLLPFPQVITHNLGVAGGPSRQVTVLDPQSQPVHNALVALYTTDKNGINIAIDQGLTNQNGKIDIYGALADDTIKAATFDGALAGVVRVLSDTTSYQMALAPTNISGLAALEGPTTPYLTLIPSSDGDSLLLSVHDALASGLPLHAMVIPGEGAGSPQFVPLAYTSGSGTYDGAVSFAGVGLGTGRVEVNGLAGGQVVAINSDFNLQALQAITTNHLYSEDGNFELRIPSGGIPVDGYATVLPTGHVPAPLPPGKQVIGSAYEVRLSGALITTTKESLVRLHYHPEVMGVFTNTAIYYWDAGNEAWLNQGGEEGEVDNALVITATRLGIYTLMGAPGAGAEVYLPIIVKEE